MEISKYVEDYELFYPPDPGEISANLFEISLIINSLIIISNLSRHSSNTEFERPLAANAAIITFEFRTTLIIVC